MRRTRTPAHWPRRLSMLLAVTLAAVGGCSPTAGPPELVVDRTACDRCGMLVSELRFAGAYRLPGGEVRTFDDLGCLRAALETEPDVGRLAIWVQDAFGSGWLEARDAWFVQSREIATPMGSGVEAFRGEPAARQRLEEVSDGRLLDFEGYRTLAATPHAHPTGAHR